MSEKNMKISKLQMNPRHREEVPHNNFHFGSLFVYHEQAKTKQQ